MTHLAARLCYHKLEEAPTDDKPWNHKVSMKQQIYYRVEENQIATYDGKKVVYEHRQCDSGQWVQRQSFDPDCMGGEVDPPWLDACLSKHCFDWKCDDST